MCTDAADCRYHAETCTKHIVLLYVHKRLKEAQREEWTKMKIMKWQSK